MKITRQGPTTACLLAFALFISAAEVARAQTKHADKRQSPRAAVQTLFAGVNASRQNPKYIEEATACLDLGGLPADQRDPELFAVQMEEILRAADVNTERIPCWPPGRSSA